MTERRVRAAAHFLWGLVGGGLVGAEAATLTVDGTAAKLVGWSIAVVGGCLAVRVGWRRPVKHQETPSSPRRRAVRVAIVLVVGVGGELAIGAFTGLHLVTIPGAVVTAFVALAAAGASSQRNAIAAQPLVWTLVAGLMPLFFLGAFLLPMGLATSLAALVPDGKVRWAPRTVLLRAAVTLASVGTVVVLSAARPG